MASLPRSPKSDDFDVDSELAAELELALEEELSSADHVQADSKIQEGCTAGLQHSILAPGRSCGCRDRSVSRGLLQLPEELLGRVVHFLSPEDLTVAAQSSRLLRVVGNSETLWQQLYISRWGQPDDETEQPVDLLACWKRRYMDKDCAEGEESCAKASGLEETIYRQIAVSRRAQPLTKAQIDQAIQPSRLETMAGNVSKWRTARGLQNASKSPRGSKHTCSGRTLFSRLGTNTFLCERCGWQHVCDNNCTERVVQRNYELPVCPISGRCFEQMLNEWEQPEARHDADEQAEDGAEYYSLSGRLAQAYLAGYNCATPAELRRRCGVVL